MLELNPDHQSVYNHLPGVDQASLSLQAHPNSGSILQELGALLADAGLEQVLAIRLIHGHHELSPGQAMVERFESLDDGPCLATIKVDASDVTEPCVPSAWRCVSTGEIEPLEYGHASLYHIPTGFFRAQKAFFARFALAVGELGLGDTLGLSLRPHALPFDSATEYLAEFTRADRSIVVKRPRSQAANVAESWETAWCSEGNVTLACQSCEAGSDVDPRHVKSEWTHGIFGDKSGKEKKPDDEKSKT
jgi:hypothetical protein